MPGGPKSRRPLGSDRRPWNKSGRVIGLNGVRNDCVCIIVHEQRDACVCIMVDRGIFVIAISK